ncbi:hypothetical protein QOZ80_9AG0683500 [Eleusine coracana subsp. coracana]|nr:hypothetical protein QOZ80_9AG0683500 [Eleusine coracana subsp. coracana]
MVTTPPPGISSRTSPCSFASMRHSGSSTTTAASLTLWSTPSMAFSMSAVRLDLDDDDDSGVLDKLLSTRRWSGVGWMSQMEDPRCEPSAQLMRPMGSSVAFAKLDPIISAWPRVRVWFGGNFSLGFFVSSPPAPRRPSVWKRRRTPGSTVRDWSQLPEDMLLIVLTGMHVADAVRYSAVCASWRAAYDAIRLHQLPSPRQPPCLLYASDAACPGVSALHCAATGAALRIPFPRAPLPRRPLLGSGHGWLVTADEASNLLLLNPVTGAEVALPLIAALHHVESFTDERGAPIYNVFENIRAYNFDTRQFVVNTEPTDLEPHRAHEFMYYRVVLSASPAAGHDCVVLILNMLQGEVSFARLGDERWTWVPAGQDTGLPWSLDLNGPSPVVRQVLGGVPKPVDPKKYLVQTPSGDMLQVWRLRKHIDTLTPVELPPDYVDDDDIQNPHLELKTLDLQLYKVDLKHQRLEMIESLPGHALFLSFNAAMCLSVKDFPGLKPNYAYVTNDCEEYVSMLKYNLREIGMWSIVDRSMSRLVDVSPVIYPWLNWPSPIWIRPSLF